MPQLCRTPAGDGDVPATDELGARMASALDGEACVGSLLRALSPLLAGFYARRLGHGQPDLDDLVQEALIAVYQHRAHYDPSRPFRAWLFGIARHKMVDYLRGRRVHLRIEQVEESVASDRFEREASARLDVERLLRALVIALSGGDGAGHFQELDLLALRRGFEAKFWPHVQAVQAALPALRKGGSVTFLTSISARIANPGTSGLAAINGAIEAMVPVLARELAPTRVNAVSPGVVETPWWNAMPEEARRQFFDSHASELPVARVGQPDDVAQAVAYLVGNGYTTGSIIECDGGLHLL